MPRDMLSGSRSRHGAGVAHRYDCGKQMRDRRAVERLESLVEAQWQHVCCLAASFALGPRRTPAARLGRSRLWPSLAGVRSFPRRRNG